MAPDPTIAKVAKLVGLSKSTATRLQRAADRQRVPSAKIVSKAITAGMASVEHPSHKNGSALVLKPLTARQRATIRRAIGSAKGLPRDLSTNPKYMEGFGRD